MKRIIALLAAATLCGSLASCGSEGGTSDSSGESTQSSKAVSTSEAETEADTTEEPEDDTEATTTKKKTKAKETTEPETEKPTSGSSKSSGNIVGKWKINDEESGSAMFDGMLGSGLGERDPELVKSAMESLAFEFADSGSMFMSYSIDVSGFYYLDGGKFVINGNGFDCKFENGKLSIFAQNGNEIMYFKAVGSGSSPYTFYTIPDEYYSMPDNVTALYFFGEDGTATLDMSIEGSYKYNESKGTLDIDISFGTSSSDRKKGTMDISIEGDRIELDDGSSEGKVVLERIK